MDADTESDRKRKLAYSKKHYAANLERMMLRAAKKRAARDGFIFDLRIEDLKFPKVCPVLGIPMKYGGGRTDNSPSVDRIDNEKGYYRGNIRVISWRANRLKSDGTAAEHKAIADYIAWEREQDL